MLSHTLDIAVVHINVLHLSVLGMEPYLLTLTIQIEPLERGFVLYQCHNDFSLSSGILFPYHYQISVLDPSLYHRVSLGAEDKMCVIPEDNCR